MDMNVLICFKYLGTDTNSINSVDFIEEFDIEKLYDLAYDAIDFNDTILANTPYVKGAVGDIQSNLYTELIEKYIAEHIDKYNKNIANDYYIFIDDIVTVLLHENRAVIKEKDKFIQHVVEHYISANYKGPLNMEEILYVIALDVSERNKPIFIMEPEMLK